MPIRPSNLQLNAEALAVLWGWGLSAMAGVGFVETPWSLVALAPAMLFIGWARFHQAKRAGEPPRPGVVRSLWSSASLGVAGYVPCVVFPEAARPGPLPAGEHFALYAVGAGAFTAMQLLGWAVRRPAVAARVLAYVVAAGVALWALVGLYEALTVKALLVIVVVLLLNMRAEGSGRGAPG